MKNQIKLRIAALTSALIASAIIFGDASAVGVPLTQSMRVSLAGIDLSTQAGVDAARERLHKAARRLCLSMEDDMDLSHTSNFRKCVDQAMSVSTQHLDALLSTSNTLGKVALNSKE
jgi:UrcA family protein